MEQIVVVGINHKIAPVELRERVAFDSAAQARALRTLHAHLAEIVVLSTCNRVEFYAAAESAAIARQHIAAWLTATCALLPDEIETHWYEHTDESAVRHLFTVAAGLDSMLVGEAQILGQVCDALKLAQQERTTGALLSRLFQDALAVGKAARTQTEIGRGALSLGYAAVELARAIFCAEPPRHVLVIGAGEMAESVARCLAANQMGAMLVANRTHEHARRLAEKFGGRALHFGSIPDALTEVDIVISSSAAPHLVVHYDDVARALPARRGRALFIIDIAVPRDVDPRVATLDGVRLYNIDDLRGVCDANLARRQREADKVSAIIEAETRAFGAWRAERASAPTIAALYHSAERLRQSEVERALKRLGALTPAQRAELETLTQSLVRKILRAPVAHLKQPSNGWTQADCIEIVRALFGLTDETVE